MLKAMEAPRKLVMVPGMPNVRISLHRVPLLKRSIFQILPNQCIMPTKKSVMRARTMMVEVPKPAMVPMPLATKVVKST